MSFNVASFSTVHSSRWSSRLSVLRIFWQIVKNSPGLLKTERTYTGIKHSEAAAAGRCTVKCQCCSLSYLCATITLCSSWRSGWWMTSPQHGTLFCLLSFNSVQLQAPNIDPGCGSDSHSLLDENKTRGVWFSSDVKYCNIFWLNKLYNLICQL